MYDYKDDTLEFESRRMSLVVKLLEACNFKCDFCCATELVEDKSTMLHLDKIFQFLERFPNTQAMFLVGGEPLLMPPDYYRKLIDHIEEKGYPVRLSITSNLWTWYKNPEKWNWLLKHPRVEIGTSFQYGEGRKITNTRVYTERIFIDVFNKFRELIPEKELCFISVIDETNEDSAIDNVRLAKRLGTTCRLVWATMSGRQKTVYPMSKLFKILLELDKEGLTEYEQTALTISEKMSGLEVACPMARSCDQWMRSLNPDGRYFSCGPMNDDLDPENEIDFEKEVVRGEKYHLPVKTRKDYQVLKEECYSCKMFLTCNSCQKHIKDLKVADKVEEHCTTMKSIMDDLDAMSRRKDIVDLRLELGMNSLVRERKFQGIIKPEDSEGTPRI